MTRNVNCYFYHLLIIDIIHTIKDALIMIHTVVIEGEHTGPVVTKNVKISNNISLGYQYFLTLFYSYQSHYHNNVDRRITSPLEEDGNRLSVNI